MITTRIAPVGIVLPSSAIAWFPPARRSAMMPEPTTVATRMAVPRALREQPAIRRNGAVAHQAADAGVPPASLRLADRVEVLLQRELDRVSGAAG